MERKNLAVGMNMGIHSACCLATHDAEQGTLDDAGAVQDQHVYGQFHL